MRLIPMELLLAALAGLAGLALLTQAKPLPTEDDFAKAKAKLENDPLDPEASNTVGKYMAFVLGDYSGAMPFLVYSPDKTLKTLAEHELDAKYTASAVQKVGMGDEWVTAAKNFKVLSPAFYDRAAQWYTLAWPGLDNVWKDRSRIQGRKLAVARPQGVARKGMPSGWTTDVGNAGANAILDGNVARVGSYSVKLPAADAKTAGSVSAFKSVLTPISGKTYEVSAYVLADGTENAADSIFVWFFDGAGNNINKQSVFVPVDMPFWNRVVIKGDVPKGAVRALVGVALYSKSGNFWIDDFSMKVDGKEVLKNTSFEEK